MLLVLVLVPSFIRLGFWQYDKYERRSAEADAIEANARRDPVPVDDVTAAGTTLPGDAEWTTVRADGEYDTDEQVLVRYRALDGQQGFHVLVPLVTADGPALLVDRGFVARDLSVDVPTPPSPPSGEVAVTGRVRQSESGHGTGLDEESGTIRYIDVEGLAENLPYPVYGAWAELVSEDPAPAGRPAVAARARPGHRATPDLCRAVVAVRRGGTRGVLPAAAQRGRVRAPTTSRRSRSSRPYHP